MLTIINLIVLVSPYDAQCAHSYCNSVLQHVEAKKGQLFLSSILTITGRRVVLLLSG